MKNAPRALMLLSFLSAFGTARAGVLSHGPRDRNAVALTFDACSTRGVGLYDEALVRTLVAERVPATFFLGGKWMREHPEATRFLASQSFFELGVHGDLHPHLPRESETRIREELERSAATLREITGRAPRLFRPPYGEYDDRVLRIASELGLSVVKWDLPSGDPDPKEDGPKIVAEVVGRARGGSIVVMHVNGRGWHTAEALPDVIAGLRARGFEFVTVRDLAEATPAPYLPP